VGPSRWSKPITVPFRDLAYPPFCSSNFGSLPTPVVLHFSSFWPWYTCPRRALYTLVVFRPRQEFTPTGHLTLW
jgi:hypothetical protein